MLVPVKVVLSQPANPRDQDELDLGTFRQGVAFERTLLRDVASSEIIAHCDATGRWISHVNGISSEGRYCRAFIQATN
jgi:hypothetical protein